MNGTDWQSTKTEMTSGWTLVLTGFIGVALGATGIFVYTQGVFLRPLQSDFGWTRAEVASMPMIFGLTLAVSQPVIGVLLDRFGTRAVAAVSISCLSASIFALSFMTGSLAIYMAIILLIGLCGSGTSTPYVRLIGGGFVKARGLALGLAMSGTGLMAIITPGLLGAYLEQHGWRASYQVLAVVTLLPLPLVLLFASSELRQRGTSGTLFGLTATQALHTKRFWLLGGSFALGGAAIVGILPHFIPLLQDAGMSPSKAGVLSGAIGLAGVISRLFTGFLCDHFFAPYITAIVLALCSVGCFGLLVIGPDFALIAAFLIGIGLGAEIDLIGYMSARYFGLRSLGSVLGVQYGLYGGGTGLGALLFGMLHDRFGDYQMALIAAVALLFIAIICILLVGPYPAHSEENQAPPSGEKQLQLKKISPADYK